MTRLVSFELFVTNLLLLESLNVATFGQTVFNPITAMMSLEIIH